MPISDMEIFGIETKENQHTAFLSWFLDPEQNMGLGLEPLLLFLNLWNPPTESGTPNPEGGWTTEMLNTLTIEIDAEPTESKGSRLDLLITGTSENSVSNNFCLILEAKVESNEHHNKGKTKQTVRYFNDAIVNYEGWGHKIFYFLTLPSGKYCRPPACEAFKRITYQDILNIIQIIIEDENIHENARERLEQYLLCWANFPERNNNGAMQIIPNLEVVISNAKAAYKYPSSMEIYGIERSENSHTNFLQWFLSPSLNMGLEYEPLCKLLNLWNGNNGYVWTVDHLVNFNIEIRTEETGNRGRIDLFIEGTNDNQENFIVVLEAKINSTEHEKKEKYQTYRYQKDIDENNRYNGWNKIYFYLTAPGSKGPRNDECFQHITYQDISNIIHNFINNENNPNDALIHLKQYQKCLSIPRSFAVDGLPSRILGVQNDEREELEKLLTTVANIQHNWNDEQRREFFDWNTNFLKAANEARNVASCDINQTFKNCDEIFFRDISGGENLVIWLNKKIMLPPKPALRRRVKHMQRLQENTEYNIIPSANNFIKIAGDHYKWEAFNGELNNEYNNIRYLNGWWIFWYINVNKHLKLHHLLHLKLPHLFSNKANRISAHI